MPPSGRLRHLAAPGSRPSEPVELKIERLGAHGDGVAFYRGRPIYVAHTLPGELVSVRLGSAKGDGSVGHLIEIMQTDPARQVPACTHFGRCGGCALQHAPVAQYEAFKTRRIQEALAHRGLHDLVILAPMAALPGTRRRVTLTIEAGPGRSLIGFHRADSHHLIDIASCPVADAAILACLPGLRPILDRWLVTESKARARGRASKKPATAIKATVVSTRFAAGVDLLVTGFPAPDLTTREALAGLAESVELARVSWAAGSGEFAEPIAIRRLPTLDYGGVVIEPAPGDFLQATLAGEQALQQAVNRQAAELSAKIGHRLRIADFYAGYGSLGLAALGAGHRLTFFEANPRAVDALSRALARHRVPASCHHRDLATNPLSPAELNDYDLVIIDPPRAGAAQQAAALARSSVTAVLAVSCNPASFARDARILIDGGFAISEIQPIDQFLWSPHIELVTSFQRLN